MSTIYKFGDWTEYATVKKWKKGLGYNSHNQKLAPKTWEAVRNYMPLFLEFTQKNPDELIEEALAGKHVVKERLADFFNWLQDEKNKTFNTSLHGAFRIIRGFYSHNDINTQKIRTPKPEPSEIQFSDDIVPLWETKTIKRYGMDETVDVLRSSFIREFLDCMTPRDRIIALCLKDSGLDTGDLMKIPLSMVRYQPIDSKRIFIRFTRNKTKEIVATFFSIETSKLVKQYITMNRKNASDDEPVFVENLKEFKLRFRKQNNRIFDETTDSIELHAVDPHHVSRSFRIATEKLEKKLVANNELNNILRRKKQSPLRPKRFRKLFSDACNEAGIKTDIKRIFMGKSDASNKVYDGKSRLTLEPYYEKIESKLWIYNDLTVTEDKDEKIQALSDKLGALESKISKILKSHVSYND